MRIEQTVNLQHQEVVDAIANYIRLRGKKLASDVEIQVKTGMDGNPSYSARANLTDIPTDESAA